jgi:hypothetical protein
MKDLTPPAASAIHASPGPALPDYERFVSCDIFQLQNIVDPFSTFQPFSAFFEFISAFLFKAPPWTKCL